MPQRARRCFLALVALVAFGAAPARGAGPDAVPLAGADELVGRVLALADERLALMPDVARAKWIDRQPVADPVREAAVIDAAARRGAAAGLAREPVAALFALEVRRARELQQALHERWRQGEPVGGAPPRSLATELRPQLDRLTGALIEALYLAAPVLAAPGDAGERYAGLARESLPAPRWNEAGRADLLAALGAVRLDAPRSLARARAAGVLRIGTPADYAPFAVDAGGGVTGADVELAAALAAHLGLRPVFVRSSWRSLLADLRADRFDIAVGGISVTPARRAAAAFSAPTSHGGKTAVGRCSDRARFASLAAIDQPGVRVVENVGGTNEAFARSTLSSAGLRLHPDNRTVFAEIVAGRADVMFTDDMEVALATRRDPSLCRLLPELYAPADKAMLLPREPEWAAAVDAWLVPEIERGTPARLLADYLAR